MNSNLFIDHNKDQNSKLWFIIDGLVKVKDRRMFLSSDNDFLKWPRLTQNE